MTTRRVSWYVTHLLAALALSVTARAQTPIYQDGGRAFRCQCTCQDSSGRRYVCTDFGPYQSKAAFTREAPQLAASYPDDMSRCLQACPKLPPPRITPPSTGSTGATGRTRAGYPTYTPSTDSVTTIGTAILGIVGALGSYFEEREAANAEYSAIQQQQLEESRRRAAEALERERVLRQQQFEQSKQQTLELMKGPKPAELQMKGVTAGSLQMKSIGEVAANERNLTQAALATQMATRITRLRADLRVNETGQLTFIATPTPPGNTGPRIAGGWTAQPASPPSPPPMVPDTGGPLPPVIGASGGVAYSTETGQTVTLPPGTGQGVTAYSVDTGAVVPVSGVIGAPPKAAPPPWPIGTGEPAYSTETGQIAAPPSAPRETAYVAETGRVVPAPPPPTPGTAPGNPPEPIGPAGQPVYSTDTGKTAATPGSTGTAPGSGPGVGRQPATPFDGKYQATITVGAPAGVVPVSPVRRFIFAVVNGTPLATEVLGTIDAAGRLVAGRTVIQLRVGPTATVIVPLSGSFTLGGNFRVTGSAPCGSANCVVTVVGARVP